jgi:hypothetical protein
MYAFTPEKALRLIGQNFCLAIPISQCKPVFYLQKIAFIRTKKMDKEIK